MFVDFTAVIQIANSNLMRKRFLFNFPFKLRFSGEDIFVKCAEENKRYDACSDLKICVESETTHHDLLGLMFPPNFYVLATFTAELGGMFHNGTCNVIASEQLQMVDIFGEDYGMDNVTFGSKVFTKEPLAIVTSNHDAEWSG